MAPNNPPTASPPGSMSDNPLLRLSHPSVTDLEQEVLDEYAHLLINVNKLSNKLADLAASPSSVLTLDGLRMLERKTATVYTLLKASVYSIVLQQQIWNESEVEQWGQMSGSGQGGEESRGRRAHGRGDDEGDSNYDAAAGLEDGPSAG